MKINGETYYLWRAVDHKGVVLDEFATKRQDRKSALKFSKKTMKRYGRPEIVVTDKLVCHDDFRATVTFHCFL